MADNLGSDGVLQVIPEQQLQAQDAARASAAANAAQPQGQDVQQLAGYIKGQFEIFRNHRNTAAGWSERLLQALRTFNGQYDPGKIQEIKKFGGSQVYARTSAQKCRAASSLLRDIYLGQDQPWALKPAADPPVPPNIVQSIDQLMQHEQGLVAQQLGKPPTPTDVDNRRRSLLDAAKDAAKKKATEQVRTSEDAVEGLLRDGGFYHALAEFLVDLPIFPFAVIKGPVVKVIPTVQWPPGGGPPIVKQTPKLTWNRVSPFDLWFTPGVADIENANVIEKLRVTRAELNDLLDLPGYNQDELRAVLDEYGRGGLYDNWDTTDAERATLESRENPAWNRSGMISMMEFNGNCQGRLLQDYGLAVPDELRDYHVQAWVIGSHVIKCHLTPSPRQRHPYFLTSFEKVPGTPVGNGLVDLLADIQEVANATLRALVNNISIASGPQVVIDDERLSNEENGEDLYPWKRWHTRNDPVGNNSQPPVQFFMPTANAQQMMACLDKFLEIADDVSAIPKYVGGQAGSGAGRTASGLAMLMGNASKILQTVSANVDRDVFEQALLQLVDLIMLTDTTGLLTGEEKVSVLGVNVAIQRETQRQRQIEFLQTTVNPVDQKIMGIRGRSTVLRAVSRDLGINGEEVVPPDDQIEKMEAAEKQQQQNGGGAIEQQVQQGVAKGVEAGVQRITTELTAGVLATRAQMPEGPPAHIGTPAGGMAQPAAPQMNSVEAARQGQGNRPPLQTSGHQMGPTTSLVGNQPGPGALPIHGGVG
jgi:hypothetical protein